MLRNLQIYFILINLKHKIKAIVSVGPHGQSISNIKTYAAGENYYIKLCRTRTL